MNKPETYFSFANREEWRAWLREHHAHERQAWLLLDKKGAGRSSLSYEEAVEEALCFGWIDGLVRGYDAERFTIRYSPRRARSIWSESNKRRVAKLIAEGRMTAAGMIKVAAAQQGGEWDAATAREEIDLIPADLEQALEGSRALAEFQCWPASRRKNYLYWLNSAKRPETRRRRIQAIVEMAGGGQTGSTG